MSDNFAAEEDWIMLKTIGVGTEVFHKMIEENKYRTNTMWTKPHFSGLFSKILALMFC